MSSSKFQNEFEDCEYCFIVKRMLNGFPINIFALQTMLLAALFYLLFISFLKQSLPI